MLPTPCPGAGTPVLAAPSHLPKARAELLLAGAEANRSEAALIYPPQDLRGETEARDPARVCTCSASVVPSPIGKSPWQEQDKG